MGYNQTTDPIDFNAKCPWTIFMPHYVYLKLRAYVVNVNNEVGGWGQVAVEPKTSTLVIEDVYLIEQTVGETDILLNQYGLAKAFEERRKLLGKNYQQNKQKLWWHSHANSSTIWSPQDNKTIDSLDPLKDGPESWLLSIVDNYKGEMVARLDVYSPFRIAYNKMFIWRETLPANVVEEARKDIKAKVYIKKRRKNKFFKKNKIYVPEEEDDDWCKSSQKLVDEVIKELKED